MDASTGFASLHFELNADPGLRVLDLDYMTRVDNRPDGVRVEWREFWRRSPQNPPGGFAIYEQTGEDDENWHRRAEVPVEKDSYAMPWGQASITVATEQAGLKPWLEVQFLTTGTPIRVGKAAH